MLPMTTWLPQFVVFYSSTGGKYLSYVSDAGGELDEILAVRGSHVSDTYSMFESELSSAHPTMCHIRSIHHNRYLQRRSAEELWIVAAAEKPNDDVTDWSTTLFQPYMAPGPPGMAQLLHAQTNRFVQWYDDPTSPYSMCMWAQATDPAEPKSHFAIFDSRRQIVLPKHVAFRGVDGAFVGVGRPDPPVKGALQFVFESYWDEPVPNEVVTLPEPDGRDGVVRIKNVSTGAFWRVDTSNQDFQTLADVYSITPATSRDTLFKVLWVDDQTIGLRNQGNQNICFRDSVGVVEGLRAVAGDVDDDPSRLLLTDLVASRRTVDIKFRLNDSRVYNERFNRVLNPGVDVANETGESQTLKINIPYQDVRSSTWKAITSNFKVGPVVEIRTEKIPYILDSEAIEMVVAPFQPAAYVWGETVSKEFTEVSNKEVTLPAMTTASVMLLATEATCDVPLTYTRYDVLDEAAGREEIYIMEDGLYTGTNYINLWVIVSTPQPIAKKT